MRVMCCLKQNGIIKSVEFFLGSKQGFKNIKEGHGRKPIGYFINC